jgi:hypothetical protein
LRFGADVSRVSHAIAIARCEIIGNTFPTLGTGGCHCASLPLFVEGQLRSDVQSALFPMQASQIKYRFFFRDAIRTVFVPVSLQ